MLCPFSGENQNKIHSEELTPDTPRIAYAGVFIWALIAVILALKPSPRILLPYLAITGALFLIIPFKHSLYLMAIAMLSHNSFEFGFQVKGINFQVVEIIFVFFIMITLMEVITGRIRKITFTPMLWLFMLFICSISLQFVRGIVLGNDPALIRTSTRVVMFYILAIPVGIYYSMGNDAKKFIYAMLVGWVICLIVYLANYFTVFSSSLFSLTGRMVFPPTYNAIIFIPLLFLIELELFADDHIGRKLLFVIIVAASLVVILLAQTRTIYLNLIIEAIVLLCIILTIYRKDVLRKRVIWKGIITTGIIFMLTVVVMQTFLGERLNTILFHTLARVKTLCGLRFDLPLIARFEQVLETITLVKGNWLFGRGLGLEWHSLYYWGYSKIDNMYFTLIGHQGLIGLIIFISIFALWVHRSIALIKRISRIEDPVIRAFIILQPALIISILTTGMMSGNYYAFPVNLVIVIFCPLTIEYLYKGLIEDNNNSKLEANVTNS